MALSTLTQFFLGRLLYSGLIKHLPEKLLVVLCFHDVSSDHDIESWMRIPETRFSELMSSLKNNVHFIHPDEIETPETWVTDRLNVLVTFDDGYVNNLRLAQPILNSLGIPALYFVSTKHILTGEYFWSDLIITPIQLLKFNALDLRNEGLRKYAFSGENQNRWLEIANLLEDIKKIGNSGDKAVKPILENLRRRSNKKVRDHLSNYRPLTSTEIAEMSRNPLVRIGSHAHAHEILTLLQPQELSRSLVESKKIIESITQIDASQLAYPNGSYCDNVISASFRSGYRNAYTVERGVLGIGFSKMTIPRILIGGFSTVNSVYLQINRAIIKNLIGKSS